MKRASFIWRLLGGYLVLQIALATVFITLSSDQNRRLSSTRLDHELLTASSGLQPTVKSLLANEPRNTEELSRIAKQFTEDTDIRITVIDLKGDVLCDSSRSPSEMENHVTRAEFIQAAQNGVGKAVRLSRSTGMEYQYLATAIQHDQHSIGFLRVAVPTGPIRSQLWQLTEYATWLVLVSMGVVALIMYLLARTLTSPLQDLLSFADAISRGDYGHQLSRVASRGDWAPLANGFERMQEELERREKALNDYNDRLEAVLMSMSEGVISIDVQRRVILANQASIQHLALTDQRILGRRFYEIVRNPVIERCVEDVFSTHQTLTREVEFHHPTRRILAIRVSWMAQRAGEAVVVVVYDVTNLRQLETMRRDFVTNVSHELKTPLSSIKAYSETLRLGAIDDQENRLRFIERIEEQANRLNDIILDLLKLASIESGQISLEIEDVDLCQVAVERVQAFGAETSRRRVELLFKSTKPKIIVRCDTEGIATILDNLISNAIRYTPEGGKVEVHISSDADMGLIEVIDTGIGIAPEYHERIFERFYRVDKARSKDLGGTGLGLSIVKHLAQAYSGSVGVTSRLGRGSRFVVRIPLA